MTESKKIIGSHNTLTCKRPRNWAARFGAMFCRCQDNGIQAQIDAGATCFDLRLWIGKDGMVHYGHGRAEYYCSNYAKSTPVWVVDDIYNRLLVKDTDGDTRLYIRLILERSDNGGRDKFVGFCKTLEALYPRVVFFEGRDRRTWEKLYTFKREGELPPVHEHHASASGRGLLKYLPRLYWLLKGRDYELQDGINLIDFVG